MGVPVAELVVDPPGHVGQVEAPVISRDPSVEDHLEEQVAELLLKGPRALTADLVELVEGLEDLMGLLEEVRPQGGVLLSGGPV